MSQIRDLLTVLTVCAGFEHGLPKIMSDLSFGMHKFPFGIDSLPSETGLSLDLVATKYGFPFEVHQVTTEDGYVIRLHRIRFGRNDRPTQDHSSRPPILILSGLWSDAGSFMINGPEKSLAFVLVERGYDVWLGNSRGTTHSKKHKKLKLTSNEFWDFSFDEMGKYDIPASVDYILAVTMHKQLNLIGHSQGGGSSVAFLAEKPEYNNKIKIAILLAPAVFLSQATSVLFPILRLAYPAISAAQKTGLNELFPKQSWVQELLSSFCHDGAPTQELCAQALLFLGGPDDAQLNRTMLPLIATHFPAGASTRQLLHFIQAHVSGDFKKYDFGPTENMQKYGQLKPPAYDLSKITAPVVLYAGTFDILVDVKDVKILKNKLKNVVGFHEVALNHLDFMWGNDAPARCYENVISYLNRYNF